MNNETNVSVHVTLEVVSPKGEPKVYQARSKHLSCRIHHDDDVFRFEISMQHTLLSKEHHMPVMESERFSKGRRATVHAPRKRT
jgi:hypothetical protein